MPVHHQLCATMVGQAGMMVASHMPKIMDPVVRSNTLILQGDPVPGPGNVVALRRHPRGPAEDITNTGAGPMVTPGRAADQRVVDHRRTRTEIVLRVVTDPDHVAVILPPHAVTLKFDKVTFGCMICTPPSMSNPVSCAPAAVVTTAP